MSSRTDVVLVMCPGWGVNQPPVGISYLKSFLERHGRAVRCFDFSRELYEHFPEKKYWDLNYPDYFIEKPKFSTVIEPLLAQSLEEWACRILACRPLLVGFSLFMSNVHASLLLSKKLKSLAPELPVVAGGAEVHRFCRTVVDGLKTFCPVNQKLLHPCSFDALVNGEGEYSLLQMLERIAEGADFRCVDGLVYEHEGACVVRPGRPLIEDLDQLPPADFSDFPLDSYLKQSLPVVTSRGCFNRCSFCADSPLWKTYRLRSAEQVVNELCALHLRYGRDQFEITDSVFNGDVARVERICDLLLSRGMAFSWSAKAYLHPQMSPRLLAKMKTAGCTDLSYGLESGSPSVLRDMRKNPDLKLAERLIRETAAAGIRANCFFIIGYPTETEGDFQMTLEFVERNARYIHRFDQVTGCHIEEDSYLGHHTQEYGIVFKDDGWYSSESTPQIRHQRLKRFRDLARQLHRHYSCEVQS